MKNASEQVIDRILDGYPELMDIEDVAEVFNCCTRTIRRLIDEDELVCVRVARKILVPKECAKDYLMSPVSKMRYATRKHGDAK
jgi:excisionase family DNA binding protein